MHSRPPRNDGNGFFPHDPFHPGTSAGRHPAIWCNLIRFRDLGFLQGQLWAEETPAGVYRPLAALVDLQDPVELNGFWPSVMARPVERNEEAWLASFLSSQDPTRWTDRPGTEYSPPDGLGPF